MCILLYSLVYALDMRSYCQLTDNVGLTRLLWQPVQVTTSTTKNNTHKDRLQIEID